MASTGEISVISKMKVAEIKKELKARGLSTVGTKAELVERLATSSQVAQDAMSEDGDGNVESEILDEDEVLGGEEEDGGEFDDDDLEADAVLADEPKPTSLPKAPTLAIKRPAAINAETSQEVQPKKRVLVRPNSVSSGKENGSTATVKSEENKDQSVTTGKKVIKLSGVTIKERLELRAQKFGVTVSDAARKEARAERFGTTPNPSSGAIKIVTATKIILQGPSEQALKKRAERFGGNVSNAAVKLEEKEKVKKRQERFGVSAATSGSTEEKKKLRAERFKL